MAAGAHRIWQPKAASTPQIDTITVANAWTASDTVTITIGSADVIITIGSLTTTAQVATTIKQAFEGETFTDTTASVSVSAPKTKIGQYARLTATVSGSVVTITGPAGQPFTMSVAEGTASTGTATEATSQNATGPENFADADNWNSHPGDDDVWIFPAGSVGPKYGLDAYGSGSTTYDPRKLVAPAAFTGGIGLPFINRDTPSLPYVEYRNRALTLGDAVTPASTEIVIGEGDGPGSSLFVFDFVDVSPTVWIFKTASGEDNAPAVQMENDAISSSIALRIVGTGSAGLNFYPGGSCRLASTIYTYAQRASDISLVFGEGVALANPAMEFYGGTIEFRDGDALSGHAARIYCRNGTIIKGNLDFA